MNNAVGPVALICAGIYLGYLTLTGGASRFVNFLKGGTVAAPAAAAAATPAPVVNGTFLPSITNLTNMPSITSTGLTNQQANAAIQSYSPADVLNLNGATPGTFNQ